MCTCMCACVLLCARACSRGLVARTRDHALPGSVCSACERVLRGHGYSVVRCGFRWTSDHLFLICEYFRDLFSPPRELTSTGASLGVPLSAFSSFVAVRAWLGRAEGARACATHRVRALCRVPRRLPWGWRPGGRGRLCARKGGWGTFPRDVLNPLSPQGPWVAVECLPLDFGSGHDPGD